MFLVPHPLLSNPFPHMEQNQNLLQMDYSNPSSIFRSHA
nr:MAG TPA: hypothetical protein [Caudoviricetes sp.]